MAYFEIQRRAAGAIFGFEGPLIAGQVVEGKIGGRQVEVEVSEEGLMLDGVILEGERPCLLFDAEGRGVRVNRLVSQLSEEEEMRLAMRVMLTRNPAVGGRFRSDVAEILKGVYEERVKAMGMEEAEEGWLSRVGQWALAVLGM